jgi:hypothetical protein
MDVIIAKLIMTSQFASTASSHTSEHLEPSELGTKQ